MMKGGMRPDNNAKFEFLNVEFQIFFKRSSVSNQMYLCDDYSNAYSNNYFAKELSLISFIMLCGKNS
jgi:hypothetical protein